METAETRGYPPSFVLTGELSDAPGPKLFDPSLKQFARAFRHGEPRFADLEAAIRWGSMRQRVIDSLLTTVAGSSLGSDFVLRGSVLLKSWFGESARPPGDIDWVVLTNVTDLESYYIRKMFESLVEMIRTSPEIEGVKLLSDDIVTEDIWTYERAPGRRIMVPWRVDDGSDGGAVQMDLVFGESLLEPFEVIDYTMWDGRTMKLQGVSRELSLIWKLVWLQTDTYPQGKDLFDAVLLGEHATPSLELLTAGLIHADPWYARPGNGIGPEFMLRWEVDWDSFIEDYPDVQGTSFDWQTRLWNALKPMFAR